MSPEDGRSVSYIFKAFLTVAFSILVASGISLATATLNPDARETQLAQAGAVTTKDSTEQTKDTVSTGKSGTPTSKAGGACTPTEKNKLTGEARQRREASCAAEKGTVTYKDNSGANQTCVKGEGGTCEQSREAMEAIIARGGTIRPEGSRVDVPIPPSTGDASPEAVNRQISSAMVNNPTAAAQVAADQGNFSAAQDIARYANPTNPVTPAPNVGTAGAQAVAQNRDLIDTYTLTPTSPTAINAPANLNPDGSFKSASTFNPQYGPVTGLNPTGPQTTQANSENWWNSIIQANAQPHTLAQFTGGMNGDWAGTPTQLVSGLPTATDTWSDIVTPSATTPSLATEPTTAATPENPNANPELSQSVPVRPIFGEGFVAPQLPYTQDGDFVHYTDENGLPARLHKDIFDAQNPDVTVGGVARAAGVGDSPSNPLTAETLGNALGGDLTRLKAGGEWDGSTVEKVTNPDGSIEYRVPLQQGPARTVQDISEHPGVYSTRDPNGGERIAPMLFPDRVAPPSEAVVATPSGEVPTGIVNPEGGTASQVLPGQGEPVSKPVQTFEPESNPERQTHFAINPVLTPGAPGSVGGGEASGEKKEFFGILGAPPSASAGAGAEAQGEVNVPNTAPSGQYTPNEQGPIADSRGTGDTSGQPNSPEPGRNPVVTESGTSETPANPDVEPTTPPTNPQETGNNPFAWLPAPGGTPSNNPEGAPAPGTTPTNEIPDGIWNPKPVEGGPFKDPNLLQDDPQGPITQPDGNQGQAQGGQGQGQGGQGAGKGEKGKDGSGQTPEQVPTSQPTTMPAGPEEPGIDAPTVVPAEPSEVPEGKQTPSPGGASTPGQNDRPKARPLEKGQQWIPTGDPTSPFTQLNPPFTNPIADVLGKLLGDLFNTSPSGQNGTGPITQAPPNIPPQTLIPPQVNPGPTVPSPTPVTPTPSPIISKSPPMPPEQTSPLKEILDVITPREESPNPWTEIIRSSDPLPIEKIAAYDRTSGQELADAVNAACKEVGCNAPLMTQAFGGVCAIESLCNAQHPHPGSQYQGFGQLGWAETGRAISSLDALANSPRLTPAEQIQVRAAANAARAARAGGRNPNTDIQIGPWLLIGLHRALGTMEKVNAITNDPRLAAAYLQNAQLAPVMFRGQFTPNTTFTPSAIWAYNVQRWMGTLPAGTTVGQAAQRMLSVSGVSNKVNNGIRYASQFTPRNEPAPIVGPAPSGQQPPPTTQQNLPPAPRGGWRGTPHTTVPEAVARARVEGLTAVTPSTSAPPPGTLLSGSQHTGAVFSGSGDRGAFQNAARRQEFLARGIANGTLPEGAQIKQFIARPTGDTPAAPAPTVQGYRQYTQDPKYRQIAPASERGVPLTPGPTSQHRVLNRAGQALGANGEGAAVGSHPRILKPLLEASKHLPPGFTVAITNSARFGGNEANHRMFGDGSSRATDVVIYDPQGRPLLNIGTGSAAAANFQLYRELAQNWKKYHDQMFPQHAGEGRWGGGFTDVKNDMMHLDLGPRNNMGAFSWENGLKRGYESFGGSAQVGQGMGSVAGYQIINQSATGEGTPNVERRYDIVAVDSEGNERVIATGVPLPAGSVSPDGPIELVVGENGDLVLRDGRPIPLSDATLPRGEWVNDAYRFQDERPTPQRTDPDPRTTWDPNSRTGRPDPNENRPQPPRTPPPPPPPPPPQQSAGGSPQQPQQPSAPQLPPGSSPGVGNQTPYMSGSCAPALTCGQAILYSRNSQCVDTPVQICANGCQAGACRSEPPPQPTAPQIKCEPSVVARTSSTSIKITWNCGTSASRGIGFSTGGTASGQASVPIPASATSTASFGVSCVQGTVESPTARCSVRIVKPQLTLVANPKTVQSGAQSRISWTTSNIDACNIYLPGKAVKGKASGNVDTGPLSRSTIARAVCALGSDVVATSSVTILVAGYTGNPEEANVPADPFAASAASTETLMTSSNVSLPPISEWDMIQQIIRGE